MVKELHKDHSSLFTNAAASYHLEMLEARCLRFPLVSALHDGLYSAATPKSPAVGELRMDVLLRACALYRVGDQGRAVQSQAVKLSSFAISKFRDLARTF